MSFLSSLLHACCSPKTNTQLDAHLEKLLCDVTEQECMLDALLLRAEFILSPQTAYPDDCEGSSSDHDAKEMEGTGDNERGNAAAGSSHGDEGETIIHHHCESISHRPSSPLACGVAEWTPPQEKCLLLMSAEKEPPSAAHDVLLVDSPLPPASPNLFDQKSLPIDVDDGKGGSRSLQLWEKKPNNEAVMSEPNNSQSRHRDSLIEFIIDSNTLDDHVQDNKDDFLKKQPSAAKRQQLKPRNKRWAMLSSVVSLSRRNDGEENKALAKKKSISWRRGSSDAARILNAKQAQLRASGIPPEDPDQHSIDNDGWLANTVDALFVTSSIFSCMLTVTVNNKRHTQVNEHVPSVPVLVWFVFQSVLSAAWIALRFFTRIRNDWDVVGDLQQIRAHYLATWFKFDLFLCLPLELLAVGWSTDAFDLITLRHFLRYVRVFSLGHSTSPLLPSRAWLNFLTFVMTMFLITHCMANLFWVFEKGTHREDLSYVASLYWASITLTTVGYGDFSAKTDLGMSLSIVAMMLGVLLVANFTSGVTYFASTPNKFAELVHEKEASLAALLGHLDIDPADMREFSKQGQIINSNYEESIFSSHLRYLPAFMEEKLSNHFKAAMLGRMKIFQGFAKESLVQLTSKMSKHTIGNSEVIIQPASGEQIKESELVFIVAGKVQLVRINEKGEEEIVEELQAGSVIPPLTGERQKLFARAASGKVEIVKVGARDLVQTVEDIPDLEDMVCSVLQSTGSMSIVEDLRKEVERQDALLAETETFEWIPRIADDDGPLHDAALATWGLEPVQLQRKEPRAGETSVSVERLDDNYVPVVIPQVAVPTVEPSFTRASVTRMRDRLADSKSLQRQHEAENDAAPLLTTSGSRQAPIDTANSSPKHGEQQQTASRKPTSVDKKGGTKPGLVQSTSSSRNLPQAGMNLSGSLHPGLDEAERRRQQSADRSGVTILEEDEGGVLVLTPRIEALRRLHFEWLVYIGNGETFTAEHIQHVLRYVPVAEFAIAGVEVSLHPPFLEALSAFGAPAPVADLYSFLLRFFEPLTNDEVVALCGACCRVIYALVAKEPWLICRKAAVHVFRELSVLVTPEGMPSVLTRSLARIHGIDAEAVERAANLMASSSRHRGREGFGMKMTVVTFVDLVRRLCGPSSPQRVLNLLRVIACHCNLTLENVHRCLRSEQQMWDGAASELESGFLHCFDGLSYGAFVSFASGGGSCTEGSDESSDFETVKFCVVLLVTPPKEILELGGGGDRDGSELRRSFVGSTVHQKALVSRVFASWANKNPDELGELLAHMATFHSTCSHLSFAELRVVCDMLLGSSLHPSALLPRSRVASMFATWALLAVQKVSYLRKFVFPMIFAPAEDVRGTTALEAVQAADAVQSPFRLRFSAQGQLGAESAADYRTSVALLPQVRSRNLESTPEPPDPDAS